MRIVVWLAGAVLASRRRLPFEWTLAAAIVCLASSPPRAAVIVTSDIRMPLPANACSVAAVFMRVVREVAVPSGVERVPSACARSVPVPPGPRGELSLQGMDLDAALDALVQLAPVYEWKRDAGVIVLRPVQAWKDTDHFLHKVFDRFVVQEGTVPTALMTLQTALGPWTFGIDVPPDPTREGMRRTFTVDLRDVTAYEAMNAVVRSHAALTWEVSYCGTEASYANATLSFHTFDGAGVGGHAIFLTYPDGTRRDPCRGPSNRAR